MREPQFYLGEAEFTRHEEIAKGNHRSPEEIIAYVQSIPFVRVSDHELRNLWRKRTARKVIVDGFSTGCSDDGLVFCVLARFAGLPTAYVETFEQSYLNDPKISMEGHVFADVYQNGIWIPYNPRYGKTTKQGKTYLWSPNSPNERFIEVARGLDFSHLYTDTANKPMELKTLPQIWELVQTIRR